MSVWFQLKPTFIFSFHVSVPFFFFFFQRMNSKFTVQRQKLLFMHCSNTVHILYQYCSRIKNIKNGSHGTFYTFKNYFATVFSVFSFQVSISVTISSIQTDPKYWFSKLTTPKMIVNSYLVCMQLLSQIRIIIYWEQYRGTNHHHPQPRPKAGDVSDGLVFPSCTKGSLLIKCQDIDGFFYFFFKF